MTSMQTLTDAIVALLTVVGVAAGLSIAFAAAGALLERSRARGLRAVRVVAAPAQHPTQTDGTRELVLR